MKHFILLHFFLLAVGLSAQTLHVEAHENNISSSDLWTEMVTEIKVENISQSNTVEVKVSKEILTAPLDTTNYFCWVNCFLAQTIVSPTQITFAPGDVDEINFSVHFNPQGVTGIAAIRYCAFLMQIILQIQLVRLYNSTLFQQIFLKKKNIIIFRFSPKSIIVNHRDEF